MMRLLSIASVPFPFGLRGVEVIASDCGEGFLTVRLQKAFRSDCSLFVGRSLRE